MFKYKHYVIFITLVIFGLAAFFLISSGYYPILSINGTMISARTIWKNYQAGSLYYQNILLTYELEIEEKDVISETDLKRSVLTQIIENNLIDQEVRRELGDDLDLLVTNKLSDLGSQAKLQEAAQTLYGLPLNDFEQEILVPLAKQEILTGRLFLDGENLDTWLSNNKKVSDIKIFSREFYWDGQEVQLSKK
ncbi:MAG: hypothetical protein Q7R86_00680 [bacterium]|nr:hypothetical protein [bacterium]